MHCFHKVSLSEVKPTKANTFEDSQLEELAEAILESGGLIIPLIVKEVGIDEYKVLAGHLAYYAALKAKEKNPRKGEMINAFICNGSNEQEITKQLKILNS